MKASRTLAIARKSLGQIGNDRRTLAVIVMMPLVLILVFGYGFGGQPRHIATAYVNADQGPDGAALLAHLPSGTLDLSRVATPGSAYDAVHSGEDWAAIVIPANFSAHLLAGNATLTVYVDATSPTVQQAVMGAVESAIQGLFSKGAIRAPVVLSPSFVYGSGNETYIDTLAPGIMALVGTFATTMLAILVLVRERPLGLLERLLATPLRPSEFVAGHALSLTVVAAVQSVVLLVAAVLIFQASFAGNLALGFLILMLFALGNIGLGMLISSVSRSEFQAVQMIPFIIFPQLLFSGALFPIDSIPVAFRPISDVLPLTYAGDALHSVLLRGWGAGGVLWDLVILVVYSALTLGAATVLVRRQA